MKLDDIFPCLKKKQTEPLKPVEADGESLASVDSKPEEALLQDSEYKQLKKIHNYYLNHGHRRRSSVTPTVAPLIENDLEELAADTEYEPKKAANALTHQEKAQIHRRLSTQLARRQSLATSSVSNATRTSIDTLENIDLKRSRRNSIITKTSTLGEIQSYVSHEHSLPSRSMVSRLHSDRRRSSVILPPTKQRRPSVSSVDLAFTEPKLMASPTGSQNSIHESLARSSKSHSVSIISLATLDKPARISQSGSESLAKTAEKVRETCGEIFSRSSKISSMMSTDICPADVYTAHRDSDHSKISTTSKDLIPQKRQSIEVKL